MAAKPTEHTGFERTLPCFLGVKWSINSSVMFHLAAVAQKARSRASTRLLGVSTLKAGAMAKSDACRRIRAIDSRAEWLLYKRRIEARLQQAL